MGYTFYFEWEVQLMVWLQSHMPAWLIQFFSFAGNLGENFSMVAVLGVFYWCIDKEIGKKIGYNLILIGNLFPMVKNVALRRRPYFDHEEIAILKPVDPDADVMDLAAQGYSFPSGHSANTAGTYGSIAVFMKKKWVNMVCIIIPFLVGCSRFIVGAHYPTDVICGWLLGIVITLGLPPLHKKIKNEHLFRFLLMLICLSGIFFCETSDYYTALGMLFGFLAAVYFEEKIVHFQKPARTRYFILRLLFGIVLFFILDIILKLPFDKDFLSSVQPLSLALRTLRYTIIVFVELGVYPMVFKFEK